MLKILEYRSRETSRVPESSSLRISEALKNQVIVQGRLKYLHSARILHRDIKPGNLLVNSNCVLKICDFGLARVEEPDQNKHMTQEVVTQYYRAPEILMGARHYTAAVDVWSVGCIFGELLRRRILFQAQSPVQQLELITELLGTPTLEDMRFACEGARSHMLRRAPKPPSLTALYTLSSQATHEAVHLLCQMLVFDPDKRITVVDALAHPYLDEGRLRYHSCMCTCCYTTSGGLRQYTGDFEPATSHPFDDLWERKLTTVQQVKGKNRAGEILNGNVAQTGSKRGSKSAEMRFLAVNYDSEILYRTINFANCQKK
ncbi:hypothetical protein K0M31_011778 [Melipona bicolor]|uniref:Protein kinase domain-containing protein n=1 Tax=Melipona bicolor TaxID=60889 RepID=A0AA40GA73_9HYME|nr:hypothetical protein K0M31_011778 [Melipona bicolor]